MPFSREGAGFIFSWGVTSGRRIMVDARKGRPAPEANAPQGGGPPDEPIELRAPIEDVIAPSVDQLPAAEPLGLDEPSLAPPRVPFSWENEVADEDAAPEIALDSDAGLADRLWAARETAEVVKAGEGRTRAALYKALALAYDFAVAADCSPDEYAEF